MDIWGLDSHFQVVKYLPYLNLQWKRRYYECGEFSAQILASDYDPAIKYLYTPDRPEMGMVQKMQSEKTVKGLFVNLSGFFMESVFDRMITYPDIQGDFTLKELADHVLTHAAGWYKVDLFDIQPGMIQQEHTVSVLWEKRRLGQALYETLQTLEMSPRVRYEGGAFYLDLWQGLDRTQSQNENAFALFGDDMPHVSSFTYVEDESNYKNIAMVMYGSDSTGDSYRYDVYTPGCQEEGRRWLLVHAGSNATKEEARQLGQEELQKYQLVQEAGVETIQDENGLIYLRDYDLGDRCDLVSNAFQKSFEARITGIDEVFKQGRHMVTLSFGNQQKTIYQKLRRFVVSERLSNG